MITYNLGMTKWVERKFTQIQDNGLLQGIIERLSGTPARLEDKLHGEIEDTLNWKDKEQWSIKEEVGHLGDLEPLWAGRIDDFKQGLSELRPADMSNTATNEAGHNAFTLEELLKRFRERREDLVHKIRYTQQKDLESISLHPRLKSTMRIIDLAYFVAEHDDHHLARMTKILEARQNQNG